MLLKATDRRFAEAASDPTKRDALLQRLKRDRKGLLIVEIVTLAVIFGLAGWGIAISNHVVEDILHSSIRVPVSHQSGWDQNLDTVRIILIVVTFLIFNLAWTHLEFRQTDTLVKFLVYFEAREKQSA